MAKGHQPSRRCQRPRRSACLDRLSRPCQTVDAVHVRAWPRRRPRATRSDPPQLEPITRVGIAYTFDEPFGCAEVGYSFPREPLVILDNGLVLPVERLIPGMRMRLEDGHVATVTKVEDPKTWEPPSRTPNADGLYARRVLGTIKRTGFAVFDLFGGDQSIATPPGHPFWSVDRRPWVASGELHIGERPPAGDGSFVLVGEKSPLRRKLIDLYNIEVEEFHTDFVGDEGRGGVLAHNGLDGDCGIPKPAQPQQQPKVRSVYADGTRVYEGQQPSRLPVYNQSFDPAAQGAPHTVLRRDTLNGRTYQGREYGPGNTPLRDIDFTNPTYPNGTMRPGHPGPPHQHPWNPVDPNNPGAGYIRQRNPIPYP